MSSKLILKCLVRWSSSAQTHLKTHWKEKAIQLQRRLKGASMESTVVKANAREVEANLSDQKESLKQTQMSCGLKLFQKVWLDGAGHKRAAWHNFIPQIHTFRQCFVVMSAEFLDAVLVGCACD